MILLKLKHATQICLIACLNLGVWILIILCVQKCAWGGEIPKEKAILACIGEAEAESMKGKVALLEALRARGTLKGVYGLNAPRVRNKAYSRAIYRDCAKAWEDSLTSSYVMGATGWGNDADLVIFKRQGWFKRCEVTVKVGNHNFYKCKGK